MVYANESSIVVENSPSLLRVAIPSRDAINNSEQDTFQRLVSFLQEYWQIWALDNNRTVKFVYMPSSDIYQALAANRVDVAALAILDKSKSNVLYSIPYGNFQQKIFRRINAQENNGVRIAIHSNSKKTLDSLGNYIERQYFPSISTLLDNANQYDALYSVTPWLLEKQLIQRGINDDYLVNREEAPKVYFHFVTRTQDQELLLDINDSLRAVGSLQAELWRKKYQFKDSDNINLTLGNYLQDFSANEKQYFLEHNELLYPVLESGFPPYIITKSFANFSERGFAIDLLQIMTEKTGLIFKPVYVQNLAQYLALLATEHADLFVQFQQNEQREPHFNFSIPYLEANYSIIYRLDDPRNIDESALMPFTIAIIGNVGATQQLKEKFPQAKYKEYNTLDEAVLAVAHGAADVFIGQSLSTAYLIKKMQLSNLTSRPLANFLPDATFVFATKKQEKTLISLLNRSLRDVSVDRLDDMYAKWSKSAFTDVHPDEIAVTYQNARYLISLFMLLGLAIISYNYRRRNIKVAEKLAAEKALSIAQVARAEAEKAAQEKLTFLARMSHEIRTPMNGVLGMAEALSFTELNKSQLELLQTLKGSARNLLALLNDVLDFSKIDAGKLTLESVPVNVNLIAQDVIKSFRHIQSENDLDIDLDIDPLITHNYYTDPTRITQILNNLLSNAIKFTTEGYIKLSISHLEQTQNNHNIYDTLMISVEDSGIGIAADKQALLFTPFIQADDDITRKFGGTGLGLSICQEIATAMGSKIFLDSTEHRGSTFHFKLKLKRGDLQKETEDRRHNIRRVNADTDDRFKNIRVLIAEDNLVNIKVLTAQLARLKINADVAHDGLQALALHEKMPYDIIISDCHMPNLDGFELAARLRASKLTSPLWLVAVTADALAGAAESCIDAGFDDYMAKPCSQEQITNTSNI
jgi:signal transduction histidine kinase